MDGIRLAVLATQASVMTESEEYARTRGKKLPGPRSFELFGFDFAIDADLKPWLLEANVTPDMLPGDPEPMATWAWNATEGCLKVITGHQSGELKLPSAEDLEADPSGGEDKPPPDRLLQEIESNPEHTAFCLRSRVNSIPKGLVCGYEVPNCNNWRLIYVEAAYPVRDLLARHTMLQSRKFGTNAQSHDSVLRQRLLPMPDTQQPAAGSCSPSLDASPKANHRRTPSLRCDSVPLRKAAAESARESASASTYSPKSPASLSEAPTLGTYPAKHRATASGTASSHLAAMLAASQARAESQQQRTESQQQQQQQQQQLQRVSSPAMGRLSPTQSPTINNHQRYILEPQSPTKVMPTMKGLGNLGMGIRGMSYSSMRLPPLQQLPKEAP